MNSLNTHRVIPITYIRIFHMSHTCIASNKYLIRSLHYINYTHKHAYIFQQTRWRWCGRSVTINICAQDSLSSLIFFLFYQKQNYLRFERRIDVIQSATINGHMHKRINLHIVKHVHKQRFRERRIHDSINLCWLYEIGDQLCHILVEYISKNCLFVGF